MKKYLAIAAAIGATMAISAPAYAGGGGGKNTLAIGAAVTTGKAGLLGTLLGSGSGHGATQGIVVNTAVTTTKGGILGLVLGGLNSGSSHHGGYGY